jgi:hypothetical protein
MLGQAITFLICTEVPGLYLRQDNIYPIFFMAFLSLSRQMPEYNS